jgi:hypothetical protein
MSPGFASPLVREECELLAVTGAITVCGVAKLIFAFTIPYLTIGMLGLLEVCCSAVLANEVIKHRGRYLLFVIVLPLPAFVVLYSNFVSLAEALDHGTRVGDVVLAAACVF